MREPWPGTTRSAVAHRRVAANISTSLSHKQVFRRRGRCTHFDSYYGGCLRLPLGHFHQLNCGDSIGETGAIVGTTLMHYFCNWCKQWFKMCWALNAVSWWWIDFLILNCSLLLIQDRKYWNLKKYLTHHYKNILLSKTLAYISFIKIQKTQNILLQTNLSQY